MTFDQWTDIIERDFTFDYLAGESDLPKVRLRHMVRNLKGEPELQLDNPLVSKARSIVEGQFLKRYGKPSTRFAEAMNADCSRYVCMVW